MRFAPLGAAVALVAVGRAFLIPPTISSSDADIINTLPFDEAVTTDGRVMEIDCPGCPVAVTDLQGKVHVAEAESILRLNFTIAHGDVDQLLLNGLQIYPIDPRAQTFMIPLTADQRVKSPDNTWEHVSTPNLGYSLSVKHPVRSDQDQMDLVAIHVEIVEVANRFLHGIPGVELKLLETASGKLMLGDAEITTANTVAGQSRPTEAAAQECTTLVCKWKAIIEDKLSKIKGCGSKARPAGHLGGPRPHYERPHGRPHGHGRPRPHGPHRPFRHHRQRYGFARFLRNVTIHVLIPVLIGIAVGITASLVGMVVGNVIVLVWRALFRRNREAQYIKVQQEEAEDSDEELKPFIEHQGPPPTYTEAEGKTEE